MSAFDPASRADPSPDPAPSRAALRRLMQGGARPAARLVFGPGAALAGGRAHEVCGPARRSFAAMAAGLSEAGPDAGGGPILWIRAPGGDGRLGPDGLSTFFNPGRLVLAAPRRAEDAPWCAEEALRSGACALVVAELTTPLRLTPVRRLHLAARAGAEAAAALGAPPPLVLLLTPGQGGCEGVETRWRMAPSCSAPASRLATPRAGPSWAEGGEAAWRLELQRARLAPPRRWRLRWRSGRSGGAAMLDPDGAPDLAAPA